MGNKLFLVLYFIGLTILVPQFVFSKDYFESAIVFGKSNNKIKHLTRNCVKWTNSKAAKSAVESFKNLNKMGAAVFFREDDGSITIAAPTVDRAPWAENVEFRTMTFSLKSCKEKQKNLLKKAKEISTNFLIKKK